MIQDQLKRNLCIPTVPKRIISLVPSQTELLVDLGLKDYLVGITKFCVHPVELRKEKRVVGGTKQVNYDKIKALCPDIILCNKEENTKEMVTELEKIAPVHVSDIYTITDVYALINQYGILFEVQPKASELIAVIQHAFLGFCEEVKTQPSLRVAYFIWKKPWMIAGKNNFIDYMLSVCNYENFYQGEERYPEINLEVLENKVDVVFLSSEPYPFSKAHFLCFPENLQVKLVDGEFFSWYGSRLQYAFNYFRTLR